MSASCEGKELALIIIITKGIGPRCRVARPAAAARCPATRVPTSHYDKKHFRFSLNISIQLHNASLLPFYNREICKKKIYGI